MVCVCVCIIRYDNEWLTITNISKHMRDDIIWHIWVIVWRLLCLT
jgi:hypothetical protein